MSVPVRFYSGDLGWVHVIPICNTSLLGPVTSKNGSLINSDSLLKLIFTPLVSLSYICIFAVLLVRLCINYFSLFSVFLMLWHLGLHQLKRVCPSHS